MSYSINRLKKVKCEKCKKEIFVAYINKENKEILKPTTICECGGKFKRIENYLE